jgi:S1-C subfamily serine protease
MPTDLPSPGGALSEWPSKSRLWLFVLIGGAGLVAGAFALGRATAPARVGDTAQLAANGDLSTALRRAPVAAAPVHEAVDPPPIEQQSSLGTKKNESPIVRSETLPEVIARIKLSVRTVRTYRNGKEVAQGTAFCYEPGIFLTNRHVVQDCDRTELVDAKGDVTEVVGIVGAGVRNELDLALLSIEYPSPAHEELGDQPEATAPPPQPTPLVIAEVIPREGDGVIVIGSPEGLGFTTSNGIVSATRADSEYGGSIQINASISHGSSGSPVLTPDGKVIGVATSAWIEGQNLNFAIPIADVRQIPRRKVESLAHWNQRLCRLLVAHAKEQEQGWTLRTFLEEKLSPPKREWTDEELEAAVARERRGIATARDQSILAELRRLARAPLPPLPLPPEIADMVNAVDNAIKYDSHNYAAFRLSGYAHWLASLYDGADLQKQSLRTALSCFRVAESLDPGRAGVAYYLSLASLVEIPDLVKNGDFERYDTRAQLGDVKDAEDADAKATALLVDRDYDGSLRVLSDAFGRWPKEPRLWSVEGQVLLASRQVEPAKQRFDALMDWAADPEQKRARLGVLAAAVSLESQLLKAKAIAVPSPKLREMVETELSSRGRSTP